MRRLCAAALAGLVLSGCVYYNTFFNARQAYQEAETQQRNAGQEVATGGPAQKYAEAIKKASKVLQNHPKSKYADDALLMIGKAFYNTGEYLRAKEKFIELASVFRESPLLPESRFYLGMCEYHLGHPEKARLALEEIAAKGKKREFRDRARFMLGRIPFEEERWADALPLLTAYLEDYGGSERALRADSMIAAAYWELEQYDSAWVAYTRLADRADDPGLKYEALYRRSEAAYRNDDYVRGLAEFRALADDDRYFKHQGILRYQIGAGLRVLDSVDAALEIFRRLPEEHKNTEASGRALFALGEIYQERGESLAVAQEFFRDAGKSWTRDPEFTAAAVQRSSEIGQLLTLQGTISGADSTRFAESHFLLGELYLRQLDLPDSARERFRLVVDDFAESPFAPLAFLNLADLAATRDGDSALAEEIWNLLVKRYPDGEAAMWARQRVGLSLPEDVTQSDILLFHAAEAMLTEEHRPDSALKLYRLVPELFPGSRYLARALFAEAWLLENYFPAGDSSVYFAYERVAEQFKDSPYGEEARRRMNPTGREARNIAASVDTVRSDTSYIDTSAIKTTIAQTQDTTVLAPTPIERGVFDYPQVPGYTWRDSIEVVFMIHINDKGEVEDDLQIVGRSRYPQIDESAKLAVLRTRFDPLTLDPFLTVSRQWYKYSLIIPPPAEGRFDLQDPY